MSTLSSRGLKYKYSTITGSVYYPGAGPVGTNNDFYTHAAEDKLLFTLVEIANIDSSSGGFNHTNYTYIMRKYEYGYAAVASASFLAGLGGIINYNSGSWIGDVSNNRCAGIDGSIVTPIASKILPPAGGGDTDEDVTNVVKSPYVLIMPGDRIRLRSESTGGIAATFRLIKVYSA